MDNTCPHCGEGVTLLPEYAGKTLGCPHCGKPIHVDAQSVKLWWVSRARVGALAIATLAGVVVSLLLSLTEIGKLGAASFFVLWTIAILLTPYKPKSG